MHARAGCLLLWSPPPPAGLPARAAPWGREQQCWLANTHCVCADTLVLARMIWFASQVRPRTTPACRHSWLPAWLPAPHPFTLLARCSAVCAHATGACCAPSHRQGSANASFKWTWVSIMCAFQILFIVRNYWATGSQGGTAGLALALGSGGVRHAPAPSRQAFAVHGSAAGPTRPKVLHAPLRMPVPSRPSSAPPLLPCPSLQIFAVLSWRQFGWRLYCKLGVDFREKGAAGKMRKALQRNAFVTLLKINAMFLVRRCARCGCCGLCGSCRRCLRALWVLPRHCRARVRPVRSGCCGASAVLLPTGADLVGTPRYRPLHQPRSACCRPSAWTSALRSGAAMCWCVLHSCRTKPVRRGCTHVCVRCVSSGTSAAPLSFRSP